MLFHERDRALDHHHPARHCAPDRGSLRYWCANARPRMFSNMTLAMAWLRVVGQSEELVFASDSRLGGGNRWDCCPKILSLPRSDALICFAGRTEYAYPLALQLARAIELYPASHDRRVDLFDLKGHCVRMFNQMRGLITACRSATPRPETPRHGSYSAATRGSKVVLRSGQFTTMRQSMRLRFVQRHCGRRKIRVAN